jgi:hypothetical protein
MRMGLYTDKTTKGAEDICTEVNITMIHKTEAGQKKHEDKRR